MFLDELGVLTILREGLYEVPQAPSPEKWVYFNAKFYQFKTNGFIKRQNIVKSVSTRAENDCYFLGQRMVFDSCDTLHIGNLPFEQTSME